MKTSPVSAGRPGAEIQAAALDTLLHGRFFRPACAGPRPGPVAAAGLGRRRDAVSAPQVRAPWSRPPCGLLALPSAVVAGFGFAAGRWIGLVQPTAAVLFAVIGAAVLNYAVEGRQRRFLKIGVPALLEPARRSTGWSPIPTCSGSAASAARVTSFFSDVAGFTSMSESLGAEGLVALLNEFLTAMTDIILDEGGTLDKYEGDAIIAFWNAPARRARPRPAGLPGGPGLPGAPGRDGPRLRDALRPQASRCASASTPGPPSSATWARPAASTTRPWAIPSTWPPVWRAPASLSASRSWRGRRRSPRPGRRSWLREVDPHPRRRQEPARSGSSRSSGGGKTWGRSPGPAWPRSRNVLDAYRKRDWAEAEAGAAALAGDPVAAVYAARCALFRSAPPPPDWDFVFELKTK